MTTNQVKFEGYFKREDIEQLLTSDITQIYVTGTLNSNDEKSSWMEIKVSGFGGTPTTAPAASAASTSKDGCPRPCP
jgi:hypothetical protein